MKSFDEQLNDLVDKFLAAGGNLNDVESALELKLMALKEEGEQGEPL